MIDFKKIEEIKNRISKVRPKSWKSYIEGRDHESGSNFIMVGSGKDRGEDIYIHGVTDDEQDFIAHAPEDMKYLIEELEKLRK